MLHVCWLHSSQLDARMLSLSRALASRKVYVKNACLYRNIITMFSMCKNFLFEKLFVTNMMIIIAESVKIEQIIVPEVVQSGNSSEAILDCIYTGVHDKFTVQWLFMDREPPVYEWTPLSEPLVRGLVKGRLDLTYRPSVSPTEERRAMRIIALDPELSGDYTCRVLDQTAKDRQTKSMLVFSPEKEFALEFHRKGHEIGVKCIARGLYPQPEVILECNGVMFSRQQVRVWRSEEALYNTENTALLSVTPHRDRTEQITCRLQIPQAGYTAIKKQLFYSGPECCNGSSKAQFVFTLRLILIGFAMKFMLLLVKTK